jgi:hypothetical protein
MTERPTDPKPLASMKPRTVVMHTTSGPVRVLRVPLREVYEIHEEESTP